MPCLSGHFLYFDKIDKDYYCVVMSTNESEH